MFPQKIGYLEKPALASKVGKCCSRLYLLQLFLQIDSLSVGKEVCICFSAWWCGSRQLQKALLGISSDHLVVKFSDWFADSLPLVWPLHHICSHELPAFFFKGFLSTLLIISQYLSLALPHKWQVHLFSQLQILSSSKWHLWSLYWTSDLHINDLLDTCLQLSSQCLIDKQCVPNGSPPPHLLLTFLIKVNCITLSCGKGIRFVLSPKADLRST